MPPSEYLIGELGFSRPVHGVHADAVYIIDTRRIRIENLDYDGNAPSKGNLIKQDYTSDMCICCNIFTAVHCLVNYEDHKT